MNELIVLSVTMVSNAPIVAGLLFVPVLFLPASDGIDTFPIVELTLDTGSVK